MDRILILALTVFFLGCSSNSVKPQSDGIVTGTSAEDYGQLIAKNTAHTNQYSGLYQTFQADVTVLTSEVQTASLRQRAAFMQWDQKQFQTEREKMLQEDSAYAKFFLRFFSAEHDYDDLNKPKTIWKVYFESCRPKAGRQSEKNGREIRRNKNALPANGPLQHALRSHL